MCTHRHRFLPHARSFFFCPLFFLFDCCLFSLMFFFVPSLLLSIKTYANGNAKSETFFFKRIGFKEQPKISSYLRCGEKEKKSSIFSFFFPPQRLQAAQFVFLVANCQHGDRNQLVRRSTLDLDIDSAHGQPARCPARPTNIDDGLEDISWVHGLGGESLPAASYGILPKLGKNYFSPFETDGEV